MSFFRHRGQIARRLILYTVLFSSLITLVATAIQVYGEYLQDVDGIDLRLQQIKKSHLQGISESVWVADHTQLQLMLAGVQSLQDIEYVEVRVNGEIFESSGVESQGEVITLSTNLVHSYRGSDQTIGHLTVQASLEGVYLRLWKRIWVILVSNAIKTFLVALFMYVLFDKLVTRHLHHIAGYAESHDLSQPGEPLRLDRRLYPGRTADELDLVVDGLNQMQRNLHHSFVDLRASERRVRLLLDSTAEAILGLDREGRCTFVNPACMRLLGYQTSDVLAGQPIHDIIRPPKSAGEPAAVEQYQVLQTLVSDKVGHSDQDTFWSADGRAIPVEWWSHPIRADGEAEGSVVAFIDISKRRSAEREIRNYRDNLEKLVTERTEALESFSYSVSHDLRSPLRSINGFSQLLLDDQDECLNEEGREHLRRIMAASRRMGQLIDDLLHLSRLSRHDMKIEEVDLSQLAMEVVESLKQEAPERTVDVIVRPAMSVTGDPGLLRIMLENLLGNAWKYTSKRDDARIEFGRNVVDGQADYYVSDNGVGFDMQYADKLFGAFQRLHGDEFEGTGIGLVIVQRIVRRHGGSIRAEGVPGKGATFYFTLGAGGAAAVRGR